MINQGVNLHLMGSNCWCARSNSRINKYEVLALYLACWRNILFLMPSLYFRVSKKKKRPYERMFMWTYVS